MKLRTLLYLILAMAFALPSFAVSDKDMEQAKVIAAKLYLRWTNNGSGYLDEVSASSMADLESKLKDQEKENLKAFKSVSIPGDYASWDKERFVQFWGTTFFTSPALSADGKRAKDRVKAKVGALKVSAPTSATETPKPEEAKPDEKKEADKKEEGASKETQEGGISIPEPQEVIHQEEAAAAADSLHVLQAEEESVALPNERKKARSGTWIYVVILVVLVVLVVWLMIYAANMMKSQGKEARDVQGSDRKARKEIEALEAENGRLKKELSRLNEAMQSRMAAHDALKTEADSAKAEAARLRAALKKAEERPATREQAPAAAPAAPTARRQEESKPQQSKILNEIFLGRANAKGLFVRGDRRPNPGHTVYKLDTKDGIVGTFRVLNTPEAFELAVSNPLQFLAGGCVCENFEEAETADKIVTETPGTAILENGCWKVLRKSRIRFE